MKNMNVLLNTIELIDENNNYGVNLTINNENYNMVIKKNDSLQNLYDQVRDEYKNIKIKNTKADIIINEKEYWHNDIIDKIYICDTIEDKKKVIPEKKNIFIYDYITNMKNKYRIQSKTYNDDSIINKMYNLLETIFS